MSRHCLALAFALALVATSPARAETPATDAAERARQLFVEGRTQFDLGHFEQAIHDFEAAYRLRPDPVFLFNIAQAHRLSGDLERALFFYRTYLRNRPDAPNRADAETRIAQCQRQLDERRSHDDAPKSPPPVAATASPVVAEAVASPPPIAPPPEPLTTTTWEGELSGGVGSWMAGGPDGAPPGFVASLAFGVVPGWARGETVAWRLGARASLWSAAEADRRTTVIPLLLEPSMQVALAARWTLSVAVGVGVAVFPSLDARSELLRADAARVTGALSAIEVRPSTSLRWALSESTSVFAGAGYAWDGRLDPYFRSRSLQRIEAAAGLLQRW